MERSNKKREDGKRCRRATDKGTTEKEECEYDRGTYWSSLLPLTGGIVAGGGGVWRGLSLFCSV
jgi:hypothetical protein